MAETFSKREREKKKQKRKKDNEARREARREVKPDAWSDMIAYVDENGILRDTPPDPATKEKIIATDIVIGVPPKEEGDDEPLTGVVNFYDDEKGYGFIKDDMGENIFMHRSNISGEPNKGDKGQFEKQRNNKGWEAINVIVERK